MIALFRFDCPSDAEPAFEASARDALQVLGSCPGFRRGWLARGLDEPGEWVLGTEWDGVGPYRRALAGPDVRMRLGQFLATARNESSAFEVVAADEPRG